MRNFRQKFVYPGAIISLASIASCSPDRVSGIKTYGGIQESVNASTKISIMVDPSSASIKVGSTAQLNAILPTAKQKPKDPDLTWTSSDPTIASVTGTGLVTALSVGGPVTITVSSDSKRVQPGTAQVVVIPAVPTWATLVAPENAPTGPIFRTTNAEADNAIYAILGGGDFQPFALWRFDLTNDSWTLVPTTDFPIGQYRQIVHDPVSHEILTYWDGLGQVYGVNENGGSWHAVGSAPNQSDFYEGAAFWNAVAGRLNVFGGYGGSVWKNTLWGFDPTNPRWALESQSAEKPWPRFGVTQAVDESAGAFFINGGQGSPTGNQFDGTYVLNDLWRLDLHTNTWTQIIPHDYAARPTYVAGMDVAPEQDAIYRFGGMAGVDANSLLNTLDRVDLSASTPAWSVVTADGTAPSARWGAGVYYDAPRHRLVVVGGNITGQPVRLDAYALSLP